MTPEFDMTVFIGRFEPLTEAHKFVIQTALKKSKKTAIGVGSANTPRTHRNPWTYEERVQMIKAAFPKDADRIITFPIEDTVYNDVKWVEDVQAAVNVAFTQAFGPWHPLAKVALIGHSKDNTTFYLSLFPQWDSIAVKNMSGISATDVRNWYFDTETSYVAGLEQHIVPVSTEQFLKEFRDTQDFEDIRDEYEFVKKYKKPYQKLTEQDIAEWMASKDTTDPLELLKLFDKELRPQWPPKFVTVDSVVVQSGHVLLVQRGARPGKGLWALPGGFLEDAEWIEDGAIRELREETKIKVPDPVLRGNIKASRVFDDPNRSARGRTITHAYLIHLPPATKLPKIKGSDDAVKAKWVPIADVKRNMMFEDHYDIINTMIALI